MDSSSRIDISKQKEGSTDFTQICSENRSQCNLIVKKPRSIQYSNTKNITWWDNEIKKEMTTMKLNEITYKDVVHKRRKERKMFHHSLTSLLSKSNSGTKSIQRIPNSRNIYPDDLASTLKKFTKIPKETARIWRKRQKTFRINPVDSYEKMEQEMKSTFLDFYNANIEKDETNVEDVLMKLFSTDVDPLSLTSAVKVISKLRRCVPDVTSKKMGKPKMVRNDMITRLIHNDLKALQKKKRTIAFGKTIAHRESHVNKYDFNSKYVNIGHPYNQLETFQAVFENILELETTKRFCAWLMKNSHIEPPGYLVQKAALMPRFRSECRSSDYFFRTLEGYNDLNDNVNIYDIISQHVSLFSDTSLDSTSSASTLNSWDISDINIII